MTRLLEPSPAGTSARLPAISAKKGERLVALGLGAVVASALLLAPSAPSRAQYASEAPSSGYVGSAKCAECHTQIHDAWSRTRHAYTVLTAEEADAAGYPLPPALLENGTIHSWADVSYVVGGRQRISYANLAGEVRDTAYHHRLAKWAPFPSMPMAVCGPCHFTGFGAGAPHPESPALPQRYAEPGVTCESCHGPGEAHMESQEAEDIALDASSRVCGSCHTSVGKVLPKDDLHDTHDQVQIWNRDPHVLGVRFRSHNAFCSDCHAPWERGDFTERRDGAAKRVFSESKQNITCIGCHNPHALTDATYRRDEAHLGPPAPPRREVYRGNDEDFTTTDFDSFDSTEEVCLDCHRGADRVKLDHANATCNDCHNTFNRNRAPESRPFHDANSPRLSCRPCHQDADHLMSIVKRDPDFLEPRHIHDLRTLPRAVIEKYGFAYPGSLARQWTVLPTDPGGLSATRGLAASALQLRDGGATALETAHGSLADLLATARGHAARGEHTELRVALEAITDAGSLGYRGLLFAAGSARPALPTIRGPTATPAPDPADTAASHVTTVWLEGVFEMAEGRFERAARELERARALEPGNTHLGLLLGLAQLGERRHYRALETLEAVARSDRRNIAARIALAAIYITNSRLGLAREHLEAAMRVDPEHALAAYFLGRTQLRLRNPGEAAAAFRTALRGRPEDLNSWFHLARAYRHDESYGAAVDTYQQILRREPRLFDAHRDLARLYKFLSDKVAMTRKREAESARPLGITEHEWQRYLSRLSRRAAEYRELALSAYADAGAIRPLDAEEERQIGEILRRAGRLGEARARFELLARNDPTQWIYRYRLGTIAIRQADYAGAIAHLEDALRLAPTEGDVYVALAFGYAHAGRAGDAIVTLERGTAYQPFNPALYTNLGAAYAERGDYQRARSSLERAVTLRTFPLPRTHLAFTNLGIVHLREGRPVDAVHALKQALHAYPEYTHASRLLSALTAHGTVELGEDALVHDDLLERFGETSTVQFATE